MSTQQTRRLNDRRNSLEMQEFKRKVNDFFAFSCNPEIEYYMIRDLAKKINLPFYKETRGRGRRKKMSSDEIVKGYCELCIGHYEINSDKAFIEKLFQHLSEQQNQHLRKLSARCDCQKQQVKQKGVWEHPVPVKYSRDVLLGYIFCGNREKINAYVDFIRENTYQVFLAEKWDNELRICGLRDKMPTGWNWEDPSNNNVFQRYVAAGIPESEYL